MDRLKIDDVSIGIRLLTFPFTTGSLFSLPEILAPAWGIFSGWHGWIMRCSGRDGSLVDWWCFNRHKAVRLLFRPRVRSFSLPEYISPTRGIRSGRVGWLNVRSSWDALFTRLMVFHWEYSCSTFSFARTFALLSARDYLPRPGNPLWPSRTRDLEL